MTITYNPDTAVFANTDKTHIQVKAVEKNDSGETVFDQLIEVSPNPVFENFSKTVSLEKVEENTRKWHQRIVDDNEKQIADVITRLKTEVGSTAQPASQSFDITSISQDDLFKLKIQSFEIEDIKNSTNRALKAKIRKANSFMEVLAFSVATILDSSTTTSTGNVAGTTQDGTTTSE